MKRTDEFYAGDLEWDELPPKSTMPTTEENFDWIEKAVWLLKGFIIGAVMVGFMSFVLVN